VSYNVHALPIYLQFPAIFDELLVNVKQFKLSRTCVDVLTSNFLCPMCANQPPMCPGRCNEIVIGCLSPLNQAVEQLDASLRLISCKAIIVIHTYICSNAHCIKGCITFNIFLDHSIWGCMSGGL